MNDYNLLFMYFSEIHQNQSIFRWSNFPDLVKKELLNLTSTGLIIMGLFGLKLILSQISHRQFHFESLKQYYFGKSYVWVSKNIPKTRVIFDKV